MVLDLQLVEGWLVDQAREHLVKCGIPTTSAGSAAPNQGLVFSIWDGLRMEGLAPPSPAEIGDADFLSIPPAAYTRFLTGCLIALLTRVLHYYQSWATQGDLDNRIEFSRRAQLLQDYLSDDLIPRHEQLGGSVETAGVGGGALVISPTATNPPDAVCIPYRR